MPAFPGAAGAGFCAVGGRGGAVIRVNNLNDDGPGSLRAAVELRGARTVIFDVSGTIRLQSPLVIRHPHITIAGQSAPGDGITLADQPLIIATDEVVVRFIRSRLGDASGSEEDAISITRGRRIILDHVSASWSVDETLSVGSRYDPPERGIYDVTVQWSMITESLNASGHEKGEHGYGSLIRGGYGARFSFLNNLWAHHSARMPRPGNYTALETDPEGPVMEFRNNVFYNWGGSRAGYNVDTDSRSTYAFIANAYISGPDSDGLHIFDERNPHARAWFEANSLNGIVPDDPWSLVRGADLAGYRLQRAPVVSALPHDEASAAEALERVLAHAGASRVRDDVDRRVIETVRDRTGDIIDSQDDVGGWPALHSGPAWSDTDGDGLPDEWERANALDPDDSDDAALDAGQGYSWLEVWLAELARR